MTDKVQAPHAKSGDEVLGFFSVTLDKGLTSSQVVEQRKKFGANELDEQEKKSLWQLIVAQFEDLLVRILLLSAVVSFFLAYFDDQSAHEGITAYVEPLVILLILIANAFVGVWQESNAEKALDALKKLQPDAAMVLRDGSWDHIDAVDVVPGDIVEVKVGDKVPADMRVLKLKTTTIRIEQSQLTGESQSVSKEVEPVNDKDCVIQSKINMLFASTTVSNGAAIGVVTGTGMSTEIGVIQAAVTEAAGEEEQTPLQQKLDDFGETLAKVIFIICALVWLINYKHFFDPVHGSVLRGCIYYFKIAVALAVAAIPEGLPAVITTCLALGTRKMAQKNAIVRQLPSVETLGCTTVICSDKTGTLTTNEMCCTRVMLPQTGSKMTSYQVEGHTYAPIGAVKGLTIDWLQNKALQVFCRVGAICNESRLSVDADGRFIRAGEPTEAAIRVVVEKLGCPDGALNSRCHQAQKRTKADAMAFSDYWMKGVEKRAVLEFTRDRKSMSVLCSDPSQPDGNVLYVKGAPEGILERCTHIMLPDGSQEALTDAGRKAIQEKMLDMASDALRTLAVAAKFDLKAQNLSDYNGQSHSGHAQLSDPANFIKVEQGLTFVGMVGIIDPPRPECKQAIEECRIAGISVIMITGDNKVTAESIALKLGILNSSQNLARKSFTGKEFDDLSEEDKVKVLQHIMAERETEGAVFSRTEPKHKQVIVKILKSLGEIAAMTGDGVNDAPALKQADIGIAMGITGTEVAKEASDMVLADDNFSTIVSAVEEGRSIYNNMKAFIRYLISSNIGEVASIFFTAALGTPEGLAPVQLLWVNLVTDGLPATALGFNPPDLNVMQKAPRRKDDNLISGWVFFRYMVIGLYVGFATVGVFVYWYSFDEALDGHTLVPMTDLMRWGKCSTWENFTPKPYGGMNFDKDPCSYFTAGKVKASTLSLTVLVVIEMLNAFNALSEDGSLIQMPPWTNPWLILACMGSVSVHFVILYTPFLAKIFAVCPLDWHDWQLVMLFSIPVVIIDEVLKFFGRSSQKRKAVSPKKD
eukprot:TRINITY_DN32008_c0_g1_i1.p1 TRINITY_DN32008_c0_g1~~TRINITY_DN32008_c0_g1_i1.p1  ORF type:complete len:1037 (-),score=234.98 TRINITY_DN32008_c0_g1_i1:88-3198(-)